MKDYLEKAKKEISNLSVKVISFDIFDTLLVRPCIFPRDIFALCDKRVKIDTPDIEFLKMRSRAEDQLNIKNANIYQIWDYIQKENRLEPMLADRLMQIEILTESQLLRARKIIIELYRYACNQGKKLIAISDMYLPESILMPILFREGFDKIERIYVSCDCHANKTDKLDNIYKYVCDRESIKPSELAHIGDNYISDYLVPRKMGVHACHVPSNVKLFLAGLPGRRKSSFEVFPADSLERTVFGFVINCLISRITFSYKHFTLEDFSTLFVFPILINLNLLLCSEQIQSSYANIQFASRDGYLPLRSYNVFKDTLGANLLKGEYLYASRLSYSCLVESSLYDRLLNGSFSPSFTLTDFLRSVVPDTNIFENFLSKIGEEKGSLYVFDNRQTCVEILKKLEPDITIYFKQKRQITKEYYVNRLTLSKNRVLVFDTGYNGSIRAISKAFDPPCKVDKVYIWGSDVNRRIDNNEASVTYLVSEDKPVEHCGAYEIWLSPPNDGTCIGIISVDGKAEATFEKKTISQNTMLDYEKLHNTALQYVKEFVDVFGDLVFLFKDQHEISSYTKLANLFLKESCIISLFKNMQFEDAVQGTYNRRSLSDFLHANNRSSVMTDSQLNPLKYAKKLFVLAGYYNTYCRTYGLKAATKLALQYIIPR